jgi:hypothetical protein
MSIKTSTFGRVELSGADATRFIEQINTSQPNKFALAAIERARKVSDKIRKGEKFTFSMPNGT